MWMRWLLVDGVAGAAELMPDHESSEGSKWNDGCGRVDRVWIYFGLAFMVRTVLHRRRETA
jgi:hypothetical protein